MTRSPDKNSRGFERNIVIGITTESTVKFAKVAWM